MIKIVEAKYMTEYKVELIFSTHEKGIVDFSYLISKETELTKPLKDDAFFKNFFIELGAIGWQNGLELSPKSLYQKLSKENVLNEVEISA